MAVPISAGSGVTVASELISGAQYQQIKVISGSAGSTVPWVIDSTGAGLFATNNLTSLASGTIILASQNGTWNTGVTGLISLASGTRVIVDAGTNTSTANLDVALSTRTKPSDQQHVIVDSITPLISLASGTSIIANINGLTSLASGTVVLAAQSGTWTVQPGNTANTTAWKVDGSAVTQPVSGNVGITGLISLASGTSVLTSFSGIISLASGTEVRSLATILNFPATQAVSQSGTWNVGVTGLISLASGTSVLTSFGGVISLASGTEIRSLATINNFPASYPVTNLVSVASINGLVDVKQNGIWNVGVTGLISLASGTSVLTSFSGLISLASGTEIRSLATILNFPATQAVSFNQLVSLASGTEVRSLATITNFPTNYPTLNLVSVASINGLVDVKQNGTWTVQPGNTANTTPWLVTNSGGLISLASGTEVRSLATILNFPATQNVALTQLTSLASGTLVGLNPGANFIGLATVVIGSGTLTGTDGAILDGAVSSIKGTVLSTASGNPLTTLIKGKTGNSANVNTTGELLVNSSQSGTWTVGVSPSQTISIADDPGVSTNIARTFSYNTDSLDATAQGVLVTARMGILENAGGGTFSRVRNANLANATTGVGLLGAGVLGFDGTNYQRQFTDLNGVQKSLVTISNSPTIGAGSNFIGLVSVASINGTVTLASGIQVIGTATVYPAPIATYTSLATFISASGAATLFVPPSGQRWILKDLIIGSMGNTGVQIQSEGRTIIPFISLATTGGYVSNFGEAGLAGASINGSFVVNLNSSATISIMANVRFQAT